MDGAIQQAIIEQTVGALAKQLENQIDSELHKLDNLQDDDIEQMRQQRLQQLKKRQDKMKEWIAKGHGEYQDVQDEKEFFQLMKGEERVICHFYRDNWPCKVMDKHMSILAKKHLETRFVKINAEKSPFLTERLKIWMLPTLALIKKEKVEDYVVGFDQLGGTDDFETDILAERLAKSEMIDHDWGYKSKAAQAEQKSVRSGIYMKSNSDEDSDFD